jgi:diacylglycerol kinase family enzyme
MTASAWATADPPQRPVLFVNPRSGGGKAARAHLPERARERGIDAVVLRPGDSLPALVDQAVADGADALGVAGGDGSLAVVAAVAVAVALPFVCIPAGTRNHFALDVGVDRADLVGSLDALTHGVERRIDVAEVNGRLFLNNVSLGIYGDAVRRPAYRDAKARTLAQTAAQSSARASRQPDWRSLTTAAAPIATRRSCSSRTTRTRSSRRASRVRARPSTAGSSASSCSIGRPRAGARAGRGRRGSSR